MIARAVCRLVVARPRLARLSHSRAHYDWDATVPVSQAATLPAAFYTQPAVHQWEKHSVFSAEWIAVGRLSSLSQPGDYVTGELFGESYIVCRDESGELKAFYNVCRHHAMAVARGSGRCSEFVCPYHGWRYALNGRLKRATKLAGIENFKASQVSLTSIPVTTVGPLIFAHLDFDGHSRGTAPSSQSPSTAGIDQVRRWLEPTGYEAMQYIQTLSYDLQCNWKVFCDNYLDGGYHVQHAHPQLTSEIDMSNYRTEVHDRCSVQSTVASSGSDSEARVHGKAIYCYLYPNLMLNRYGRWLDTNLVLPLSHDRCRVIIDYYYDGEISESEMAAALKASDQVQREDVDLCAGVQRGLGSVCYSANGGRYAPKVEFAMHDFHRLYYQQVQPFIE